MLYFETFLSPNVRHMLCDLPAKERFYLMPIAKSSSEALKEIDSAISEISLQEPTNFLSSIQTIMPSVLTLYKVTMDQDLWSADDMLFLWLSKYSSLPSTLSLEGDSSRLVLPLLKFISALERALGDICVSCGKPCPFLLRDLLLMKELGDVFGERKMKILQILIGNPNGINLRNLMWHGFLVPQEFPAVFVPLLVYTCKEMAQAVHSYSLPSRPIIKKSFQIETFEKELNGELASKLDVDTWIKMPFIATNSYPMIPYIKEALRLYSSENFGDCVILLLPCLENIMRILFASVNNCESRILTAESSTFYTTMDEVLAQYVNDDSENKFRFALGDNIMMLFMDLFALQDGIRLRDRLSHGEMSSSVMGQAIANALLYLYLKVYDQCVQSCEESRNDAICSFCGKRLSKNNATLAESERCELGIVMARFSVGLECYKSLFHSFATGKRTFEECRQVLKTFTDISVPEEYRSTFKVCLDGYAFLTKPTNTLYRNDRRQIEASVLLKNCSRECLASAENVKAFLDERWRFYNERSLRSRQRSNYERLISRMPEVMAVFTAILTRISEYYQILDETDTKNIIASDLRLLKRLLKTAENLRTLTSKNKWDDACILIQHISQLEG